jgi:hypothetical protein
MAPDGCSRIKSSSHRWNASLLPTLSMISTTRRTSVS